MFFFSSGWSVRVITRVMQVSTTVECSSLILQE
jgi:hypothetical protein